MKARPPGLQPENVMDLFDVLVRIALGFSYLLKGLFAGAGAEMDPDG